MSSLGGVGGEVRAVGGIPPLVQILSHAERGTEKAILTGLDERDPELAEQVRSQMFMFEDLTKLEDRAIQLVVRQVPVTDLATAMKGVPDAVRSCVLRNMSERAALSLAEEIDVLGPVRIHLVEEAQAAVVAIIRRLETDGEIIIGRPDEDAYVA
jgi:flagellar motor switch protein FliG